MSDPDYKALYEELRGELGIHTSHTPDRVLEYVRLHNDRHRAAQSVINAAGVFLTEANEHMRKTW